MKAADIAFMQIFHVRRVENLRISHVSWDKIPDRLVRMFCNIFSWYGYQDYHPIYSIPAPLKGMEENISREINFKSHH
jgi:hypothetical protein